MRKGCSVEIGEPIAQLALTLIFCHNGVRLFKRLPFTQARESMERLDDDNYQYHKFYSETPVSGKYLLVVVRQLNDEGFVITAFFLRRVREKGKVRVYEK